MNSNLVREYSISLSGSTSRFTVKSIHVSPGQELSPGLQTIDVDIATPQRDGSLVTKSTTFRFEVDRYKSPRVTEVMVHEGDELTAGGNAVFGYEVEETFPNLIELKVSGSCRKSAGLFRQGKISDKKLQNAIKEYAPAVTPERVCFLYDDTVFGSAKDGFLVTDSAFYFKSGTHSITVRFNDIIGLFRKDDGLHISMGEQEVVLSADWPVLDTGGFEVLLAYIKQLGEDGLTKDADGLLIIEDMSDDFKLKYLEVLLWLTYSDDSVIDPKELSELQILMTQLKFSADLRHRVREAIGQAAGLDPDALVEQLDALIPSGGSVEAIHASLMKDAIRVHRSTSPDSESLDSPGLSHLSAALHISPEQIELLVSVIKNDEDILSGKLDDDQIVAHAKELAAKASAVGIPIAAVYLSGSVVGLSAAGVTSGLATLGLGGVLGFSSMVTGIGVAVLLGVGAYKGIQYLTGGAKRDRESRREYMLKEVLRIHQRSISNLGEDIAYFAEQLVDLTKESNIRHCQLETLGKKVKLLASALGCLRKQEGAYEQDLKDEQAAA